MFRILPWLFYTWGPEATIFDKKLTEFFLCETGNSMMRPYFAFTKTSSFCRDIFCADSAACQET
jgi:hypothetical protein